MAAPAPCRISPTAAYKPLSYDNPTEARLDQFGRECLPLSGAWDELRKWWLRHPDRANTPNWDIAVACEIDGKPGLILVEAKANVPEMSDAGKAPHGVNESTPAVSKKESADNLAQIDRALEAAREGLAPHLEGIKIGSTSHYQLSNRLAFAWKLATCGIPTVLIYLGFTGDCGMRASLRGARHWESEFRRHLAEVGASGITEAPILGNGVPLWVLCRAREVMELSPPARPGSKRRYVSRQGAGDSDGIVRRDDGRADT